MTKTATKERAILFSGAMVRAILDGRKTQTRRVLKPQPEWERGAWSVPGYFSNTDEGFAEGVLRSSFRCPYGQPGDRLYVRETWGSICPLWDHWCGCGSKKMQRETHTAIYRADPGQKPDWTGKWCPSIYMPRWASRLTLEVTGVRVERVQEIRAFDAKSEGVDEGVREIDGTDCQGFRCGFANLWDSINAKRGHGWDMNPWVWVVEFKVA